MPTLTPTLTLLKARFKDKGEETLVLDSSRLIRYKDNECWEEDGLHMTEEGYDLFGMNLGTNLRSFIGFDSPEAL